MKQALLKLFVITMLFSACQSSTEDEINSKAPSLKTTRFHFSDSLTMDTFSVELSGSKPKDMLLTFKITTAAGNEIYKKLFKAKELIDNYKETVDLSKSKSQRNFILEEFNQFLDEDNLLEPAIMPDQQPDKYSPDRDFFLELQESQLPGFKFRSTKETKIYIGWSSKTSKVKVYYKCCE